MPLIAQLCDLSLILETRQREPARTAGALEVGRLSFSLSVRISCTFWLLSFSDHVSRIVQVCAQLSDTWAGTALSCILVKEPVYHEAEPTALPGAR